MSRMRKLIPLLLAIVMTFALVACTANNEAGPAGETKSPDETGSEAEKVNDSGEIDTSDFVTISWVMLGDKPTNGQLEIVLEEINKILKEKINAHMEIKWVEWADWSTKYNLLLASGEPLDLIKTSTTWLDGWYNAQRNAFLPLDDLLPKYTPVTWQEITPEEWEETKFNGKIMFIPENNYTQWVDHGIFYRGDWAKEFGITEPITDFQTIGKYFQGIKDNKPDIIPWDVNGTTNAFNGYVISNTDAIEMTIASNLIWTKSYDERYTAYSPIFDDTYLNFAKLMKEWGDNGYWREDVLNYKGDTRALLRAGKTGADAHHTNTFKGLRPQMDEDQPGSDLQMFAYASTRNNLISSPITHDGFSIGANSKNPERALMVYELIRNDPELYRLMNYGIEGVQYVIEDGKRKRPEGYDAAKHEFYTNFWGGRVDKNEIPSVDDWEGIYDVYERYEKIRKPYPYGRFVFDKSSVEAEIAAISQVNAQFSPAIAWGKAGDPVVAVEDFRKKLKAAGFDKVMQEFQRQLDEFKTLIEG